MSEGKDKTIKKSSSNPNIGYQMYKDPKKENTATDIYYETKRKKPYSKVSIPTFDSVIKAKEWVDDVNKM